MDADVFDPVIAQLLRQGSQGILVRADQGDRERPFWEFTAGRVTRGVNQLSGLDPSRKIFPDDAVVRPRVRLRVNGS
jgi:hypothetical protein